MLFASDHGYEDIVEMLIAKGALVNVEDTSGNTPLLLATKKRIKRIVEMLIANKANVNASDEYGNTSLMAASETGEKDIAELLIDNGANVNAKNISNITPLMLAARKGHKELARLLIVRGADTAAIDTSGKKAPLDLELALENMRQLEFKKTWQYIYCPTCKCEKTGDDVEEDSYDQDEWVTIYYFRCKTCSGKVTDKQGNMIITKVKN